MSNEYSIRFIGGILSVASGVLLFFTHLFGLIGSTELITIFSKSIVLFAHLMMVFVFIAIYESELVRKGLVTMVGMIFSVFGTMLVSAIVYVEIAGASGVEMEHVFKAPVASTIFLNGPLMFVFGMILFGIQLIRSDSSSRLAGLLLVLGTIVFATGSIVIDAEIIFSVIGSALTGSGFVQLGLMLKR
ncbi:hypothetical protein ACM26V_07440 [Salipaludibacillus sp. HK11]|uniref:hypothetical protein n=1 Tax=Salipaludibacillus sp. HK11 TaxID=3394320 RepID=UPI0039FCDB7C